MNRFTFASYLFASLPVLLVTGPFLPDLLLSLTTLFILFFILKEKNYELFNNFTFKIFIFIIFSFLISSILSDDMIFSFESSLFYFRYILFSIAIFYICNKSNFLKHLLVVIFLSMLIVSLDAYWEYITDKNFFFGNKTDDPARIGGLFGDELILGSYLARSLPILCGLYFYFYFDNKKYSKVFYIFITIVFIIIFLSGERTAFLISSLFFSIFLIKYLKFRYIIIATAVPLICISLIFSTSTIVKDRMLGSTINSIKLSYYDENKLLPYPYDNFLKTSINMFKDNLMFGIGPKMYRKKCSYDDYGVNDKSCSTHPHNIYFQLFAETGIVGISLFLIFYLYISKCLFNLFQKKLKTYNANDHISFFMFASIFINFWPFMPSGSFFNNWINVLYFLPFGIYLYSSSKLKISNE